MTGLKLRDDAYFVPTDDGICIMTNSGEVVLTGPSIFQWVDRLAPYLDGQFSLTELTASMPAERRAMTERVIGTLREHHVVVETTDPPGDEPIADTIGVGVVVIGAGRLLEETVAAVLATGSPRVHVWVTGDGPTDLARLADTERHGRLHHPHQQVSRTVPEPTLAGPAQVAEPTQPEPTRPEPTLSEPTLPELVHGCGIVLYAADQPAADRMRSLDRACARAGVPFVSVVPTGDAIWLGPFGLGRADPSQPTGAWHRLIAMDVWPAGVTDLTTGAAATVVANQLVRGAAQDLTGTAEPAPKPRMTRIDLSSLDTQRHGFLPHPFVRPAPAADPALLLSTVARLRGGPRVDPEAFSRQVTACLQPWVGVLGEVTERDFVQLPLAVSEVQVSDPVGLLGPGVPRPVAFGADLTHADARRAAVLRGLAAYSSLMVDPRRLHAGPGGAAPATRGDEPATDLAELRAGAWTGFVWGYRLADGTPQEVPADVVFPALREAGPGYRTPPGVAAGYDWAEAVRRGLLDHCREWTVRETAAGVHPCTPVDWTTVVMDAHGDRYRSIVPLIGERLEVFDVTGSLRVPTLAFCLDGVTVAYASGYAFVDALRDGLVDVLLSYQARANAEPEYAPQAVPPLPPLPPLLPTGRRPRTVDCPSWTVEERDIVARLAGLGRAPVVVPLDHDPAVTDEIMPYLVHVVLGHG